MATHQHQLDFALLNKMARFSKIAYSCAMKAKSFGAEQGYLQYEYLDRDGAQCHIFGSDADIIFAFRGTEKRKDGDIRASLNFWKQVSLINGSERVHGGYFEEYNAIHHALEYKYPDENSFITIDVLKNKKVYFTGHSLGGALATIACSRLFPDTDNELITFGSPRVGNIAFSKMLKHIPHKRVVNNNDIVCNTPPRLMNFRHHGDKIYINRLQKIQLNPTFKDVVFDRLYGLLTGLRDPISDHKIDEYLRVIEGQSHEAV